MRKFIFIFYLFIYCIGCTPAAKLFYGVRQPKKINKEAVEKSIKKYELNDYKNYAISDSGFLKLMTLSNSINIFLIFDRNGKLVLQKDSSNCSSKISTFLDFFNDTNLTILSDKITYQETKNYLRSLNGDKVSIDNSDKDYYIILTWSTFAGKFNKKNTVEWANKLKKRTDLKLDIKYVNLDPRDFWMMDIN